MSGCGNAMAGRKRLLNCGPPEIQPCSQRNESSGFAALQCDRSVRVVTSGTCSAPRRPVSAAIPRSCSGPASKADARRSDRRECDSALVLAGTEKGKIGTRPRNWQSRGCAPRALCGTATRICLNYGSTTRLLVRELRDRRISDALRREGVNNGLCRRPRDHLRELQANRHRPAHRNGSERVRGKSAARRWTLSWTALHACCCASVAGTREANDKIRHRMAPSFIASAVALMFAAGSACRGTPASKPNRERN